MSNRFPTRAFLLAVLIELALAGCAAWVLAGTPPAKPAVSEPVPLTLLAEAPPEPEKKPQPKPPEPPKPVTRPTPVKPKAAPAKPQPPVPAPPQPAPQTEPVHTDTPTAFTEPAQAAAPSPPPPAPNVSGKSDRNAEYAAKVRAAVQAAVVYPPAAASLHFTGRVRVEFHLRDGVAGQARVLIASGIGMIDRAALQSVQNAHYPDPPADMHGSDLTYQVWVDFQR
jgi:protein TonB